MFLIYLLTKEEGPNNQANQVSAHIPQVGTVKLNDAPKQVATSSKRVHTKLKRPSSQTPSGCAQNLSGSPEVS